MTIEGGRVAVKEGLFSGPLDRLEEVHLCASRCQACGEHSLGTNDTCANCGAGNLTQVALGDRGSIHTYTVVRHKPPGNYQGPAEFKPFGVGLVEIDDVIRVMAPLALPIEQLAIGMTLRFRPFVLRKNEKNQEVVAFAYAAGDE